MGGKQAFNQPRRLYPTVKRVNIERPINNDVISTEPQLLCRSAPKLVCRSAPRLVCHSAPQLVCHSAAQRRNLLLPLPLPLPLLCLSRCHSRRESAFGLPPEGNLLLGSPQPRLTGAHASRFYEGCGQQTAPRAFIKRQCRKRDSHNKTMSFRPERSEVEKSASLPQRPGVTLFCSRHT
jgi:hypothetical protein